jgi:Sec-independent protein translocase protein TatA
MSLSEMLFLGLLGLVIFGPKKLAEDAPQAGKTLARLKESQQRIPIATGNGNLSKHE